LVYQPDAIGGADGRIIVMIVSGVWFQFLGLAAPPPLNCRCPEFWLLLLLDAELIEPIIH